MNTFVIVTESLLGPEVVSPGDGTGGNESISRSHDATLYDADKIYPFAGSVMWDTQQLWKDGQLISLL